MSDTANSYYLLDSSTQSLVDFFAKATNVKDEDFFKAKQECILARYALRDKMQSYTALRAIMLTSIEEGETEQALLNMTRLDMQAEKLIMTVEKLVRLLKTAAEIEVLSCTKFDGVQLFHLVQQIPAIISTFITDMVRILLETFLTDILDAIKNINNINSNSELEGIYKQARLEIPVLAASFAKEVADKLAARLSTELRVIDTTVQQQDNTNNGKAVSIEFDRVKAMLGSVPREE